jgi:hypothetical protein
MSNVSTSLMEGAREIAAKLEAIEPGKWSAVEVALLASPLYEAIQRERAQAASIEAGFVLDGAIARRRRRVERPERMRDEIRQVILFLLNCAHAGAGSAPPRFRLIQGGLAAGAR